MPSHSSFILLWQFEGNYVSNNTDCVHCTLFESNRPTKVVSLSLTEPPQFDHDCDPHNFLFIHLFFICLNNLHFCGFASPLLLLQMRQGIEMIVMMMMMENNHVRQACQRIVEWTKDQLVLQWRREGLLVVKYEPLNDTETRHEIWIAVTDYESPSHDTV